MKRIKIIGKRQPRIISTSKAAKRIDPIEVMKALGAEVYPDGSPRCAHFRRMAAKALGVRWGQEALDELKDRIKKDG